jgi:hypothetical protein
MCILRVNALDHICCPNQSHPHKERRSQMKKRRQQEKKRKKRSFKMPEWSKMIHRSKKVEVKPPPTLVQRFTNALLVPEPSIAATIVTLAVFMLTGLYLWRRYVGVDRITQRMREIIELGNVFILSCSCCGRKLRPLPYLLSLPSCSEINH